MPSTRSRLAASASALLASTFLVTLALAQDYSPYLETTGRGAFDLYRQAVWCGAVLEQAQAAAPDAALSTGLSQTLDFAAFMLATGDVVDTGGTVLSSESLAPDLEQARDLWNSVREATAGAEVEEIARCLRVFGRDE